MVFAVFTPAEVVSPPTKGQLNVDAMSSKPVENPANQDSLIDGRLRFKVKPRG